MFFKRSLLIAGLALSAAGSAQAIEFTQTDSAKSSLKFVTRQMGVPVDGLFRKYATQLRFDPAKPTEAKADIEIDLASIDAGSKDANDEVAGKAWFNTKQFPTAKFVSGSVRALGNNRFEVAGKMTIKGRTRDVVAPFSFKQDANRGIFDGAFTLKRADFAIGEGVWADFETVANEIQIKFHFEAALAAAKK
jgi:polyisoprenoid-binding protein YceI